jgi:hypothetical protein
MTNVFYHEQCTDSWEDMGMVDQQFIIKFSPDAALIYNDAYDTFSFEDVQYTETYDCSITTFTGETTDYEPIEFSHVFYYGNGTGYGARPTGYAISVYYIALDIKLVHIIY